MPEKKRDETHPPFFADESEEPTIVWVRPPTRLRGFTRRVHFLARLAEKGEVVENEPDDEADTEPELERPSFDEVTRG